jgi:DNA-binding NtrC family response regulator
MTRVLLVYHDVDVADIEADELRRAGYEVDRCAGPIGGNPCPVLNGKPCWQVAKADVLVYDAWEEAHGGPALVADLRELHPDKPLVLTTSRSADEPDAVAPTRATLVAAVEQALRTHALAPFARRDTESTHRYHGARW